MLIGEVKSLEQRLAVLDKRITVPLANPVAVPVAVPSVAAPVPSVASAVVASAVVAPAVVAPAVAAEPPALPVWSPPAQVAPAPSARVVAQPEPLFERLRDLSLLPPADLKGEYSLGAWWAVRVGGVLAVAAVVFLGFWLNLNWDIPAIVRVLEVALVGAGLFWGGIRLSAKRKDLGEVLAASGLAVWQFAAWATYGLDKMRVCDSPAQAALVQFLVAVLIAAIALWRNTKLFGQLAVIFAVVAVCFSIGSGSAPASTATGAGLIALLGVILMVRGPWGTAGVIGLIGSQVCLLFLYDAMPTNGANYLPLQLAALGSFLVLWLGERLVKDDAVLLGRDARSAFQLASFFAPACISLLLATGGENDRATVSLLIAAVASIAGYLELRRNTLVSQVLLLGAVGFTGAGFAWLADPHLVWLIWALAAAATLVVGTRTRSELVRWSSEILAAVSAYSFLNYPSDNGWFGLVGIAALGVLLAFREDWERPSDPQRFRRVIGILGLAIAALVVQDRLGKVDGGWTWITLLLLAAFRFRPALLWAAVPGYLLSAGWVVLAPLSGGNSWVAFWAAVVASLSAFALWPLIGRVDSGAKALRYALGFLTALVGMAFVAEVMAFVAEVLRVFFSIANGDSSLSAWRIALTWGGGTALLVGVTAAWRRLGAEASDLCLVAWGALGGFFINSMAEITGMRQLGLAHTPVILLGLACLLYVLVIHTREQGSRGTLQRALLGAVTLFFTAFPMLANLPGAGVSLFWALASVVTFVIGHLLATRSLRMVGLVGLAIATIRVLSYDITDMLGRILACAAVAVAFFGVAWLYGRITADKKVAS